METINIQKEQDTKENKKSKRGKTTSKVYCANCIHCVLIRKKHNDNNNNNKTKQYVLRVRCKKGMWKKKLGDEKLYKFFSVGRRTMGECSHYEPMGELKQYLKDLRKSLPVKDEIYEH